MKFVCKLIDVNNGEATIITAERPSNLKKIFTKPPEDNGQGVMVVTGKFTGDSFRALSYCFGLRDRTDYVEAMDKMWKESDGKPLLLEVKWPDRQWPWIRKVK